MESPHPLYELWTPDSWIEKAKELQKIPVEELTWIEKYQISLIVFWMVSAPVVAGVGAIYAVQEYNKSKAAKQIGTNQ